MEFHGLFVQERKQAKILIFSFDAEIIPEKELSDSVFYLETWQTDILTSLINYVEQEYSKIEDRASEDVHWFTKYQLLFEENPKCLHMIATYIYQLILSLPNRKEPIVNNQDQDSEVFWKAVDWMQVYLHTGIAVADLAKHVNVSESTLLRIFRKYTQTSVHRYFLLMKMKSATQMLESGMSVGQVAEKLGFNNSSYFSVCYKRETGKTPSMIRAKRY